jgi:hypothetical protein
MGDKGMGQGRAEQGRAGHPVWEGRGKNVWSGLARYGKGWMGMDGMGWDECLDGWVYGWMVLWYGTLLRSMVLVWSGV